MANSDLTTTQNTPVPDLRYVHLLSFAKVGQNENGTPTVFLLDEDGHSKHNDPAKPLVFTIARPLPTNRVFTTVLDDGETPVDLVNILAEFTENQFIVNKENIPSLGNWSDLEPSTHLGGMNPIGEPPRQVTA